MVVKTIQKFVTDKLSTVLSPEMEQALLRVILGSLAAVLVFNDLS